MLDEAQTSRLIDLKSGIRAPLGRTLFKLVEQPVEHVLSVTRINRLYAESRGRYDQVNYFPTVLEVLDIEYELYRRGPGEDPRRGARWWWWPTTPSARSRGSSWGTCSPGAGSDVRLLGNHLLARRARAARAGSSRSTPSAAAGPPRATSRRSRPACAGCRAAARWACFPAGHGVAPAAARTGHLRSALAPERGGAGPAHGRHGGAGVLRGAQQHDVPAGRASSTRGCARRCCRTSCSGAATRGWWCGSAGPSGPRSWPATPTTPPLTSYLRWKTHMLERREQPGATALPAPRARRCRPARAAGRRRCRPAALAAEMAGLPRRDAAARAGRLPAVRRAGRRRSRWLLREIGRLREKTFRAVSEGTGRATDLDRYDEHYVHLFMWNRATQRAGGQLPHRAGRRAAGARRDGRALHQQPVQVQGGVPASGWGRRSSWGGRSSAPSTSASRPRWRCCGGASASTWCATRATRCCSGRSASAATTTACRAG